MHKIKVAHEAPIQILDEVAKHTDYSYALVHLFEESKEYFEFFQSEIAKGRTVILDNSIFELGEAFQTDKYVEWINRLKPTEYIIPDVLEHGFLTKQKASEWMSKFYDLPGKKIGVVQGKSYGEIVNCYEHLIQIGVDKIAISFDYSYYLKTTGLYGKACPDSVKLAGWMIGRITLIERMLNDGVINLDKPHHLLGASMISEFQHYKGDRFHWIESLDTSNPVVTGFQGISYDHFNGLSGKPKVKLFEIIDRSVTKDQLNLIIKNIDVFKNNL
jgi:hypothetical protein